MIVSELETNLIPSGYQFCKDSSLTPHINVSVVNSWQEADCRIISHVQSAVQHGCKKAVVISNDADNVVLLLYYVGICKENG